MINRAIEFVKLHAYDTVLALFILVFGGSIIGLWNTFTAALVEYPAVLGLMCGLSFFIGLSVSAVTDRKTVAIARIEADKQIELERMEIAEQRRKEEEERARNAANEEQKSEADRQKQLEKARSKFVDLCFRTKDIILALSEYDSVDLHYNHARNLSELCSYEIDDYITEIEASDYVVRWSLCSEARRFIEDNDDLLAFVREDKYKNRLVNPFD